jgi:hypothetical protein
MNNVSSSSGDIRLIATEQQMTRFWVTLCGVTNNYRITVWHINIDSSWTNFLLSQVICRCRWLRDLTADGRDIPNFLR